ncbi:MAG: DUF3025 domain-containing protein [Lautropia sp.]|nr:DUF3025 domain-containing protein [Lautropia sp.]
MNSPTWRHPGFWPYWSLLRRLAAMLGAADDGGASLLDPSEPAHWCSAEWVDALNRLAAWRGLKSAKGVPLRFVLAEGDGALDYERRIHDAGEVACRLEGAGARHDFHNALVWLRFPRLKMACNWLHCREPLGTLSASSSAAGLSDSGRAPTPTTAAARVRGRGRRRDAITLLDENGALWPAPMPEWVAHLEARRWKALFVDGRQALLAAAAPVVVGHGLMEKMHCPYKSMTAKLLPCMTMPTAGIDRGAARHLLEMAEIDRFRPAVLLPLPLQGWPGWDPANQDPVFYEDQSVFRSLNRNG